MAGQTGPKSTWQLTVTVRVATTRFRSPATQNHKPVGNSSDLGEVSSWRQAARGFRPRARQVPKTDASVILLSVPRSDRVPPLTLRLITRWRRLRSAELLSDGTSGSSTKTQSSPYPVRGRPIVVVLNAPAQFVLDSRRVSQERAADGQQLPLPGRLGNTPSANSPHQI